MNELALFAGAGGGILGGKLLGWRTVCAVEWEPYPASVLCARQNDGFLPPFPVWDDVQTFDGKPWRGIVDVVSGGFPCQDISAAGKGAGIDGERSGMWKQMARIVCETRPNYVFVENSPMLTSRGLGVVLGDLAEMGFDARWGVLGAADVGANHQRDRIWIVAGRDNDIPYAELLGFGWGKQQPESTEKKDVSYADHNRRWHRQVQHEHWQQCAKTDISNDGEKESLANASQLFRNGSNNNARISLERETQSEFGNSSWEKDLVNANSAQCKGGQLSSGAHQEYADARCSGWWSSEPNVGRVADGVAARVDRLKAIGNGQVPIVAATAFNLLK